MRNLRSVTNGLEQKNISSSDLGEHVLRNCGVNVQPVRRIAKRKVLFSAGCLR